MKSKTAFTLVELLIVVIILAILAAIILPKFSTVTASARATMLMDDLRVLRSQMMVFKAQHNGVAPGYPGCDTGNSPDGDVLTSHITLVSTAQGLTAPVGTPGFNYGPYMREMPENPINGKKNVLVIADGADFPTTPSDQFGWVYQPSTLTFRADSGGTDEAGKAYFEY
jgi:prepilin-type N-terminal cleavage/methylation domain-containing protein